MQVRYAYQMMNGQAEGGVHNRTGGGARHSGLGAPLLDGEDDAGSVGEYLWCCRCIGHTVRVGRREGHVVWKSTFCWSWGLKLTHIPHCGHQEVIR